MLFHSHKKILKFPMNSLSQIAGQELPRLHGSELRTTGRLKARPADFVVDEIPAYEPSGTGTHLFLRIEKEGVSAEQLLMHISKTLEVHRNDIGVAGLKDRQAVTRQWVSVPAGCEGRTDRLNTEDIRLIEQTWHTNKLKTGHLRGNRFRILVRETEPGALEKVQQLCERVLSDGVPNYFGKQRFGNNDKTLVQGEQLLRGEVALDSIPKSRRKFVSRLALSAAQSALFNLCLAERIRNGSSHRVLLGDVLQVTASGGPFVSTDPAVDQVRLDHREVTTTGPIVGPKMKAPTEIAAQFESKMLSRAQLSATDFERYKKLTSGTRRPLILWLDDLEIGEHKEGLQFEFTLPSGAYATVVMREFLNDPAL